MKNSTKISMSQKLACWQQIRSMLGPSYTSEENWDTHFKDFLDSWEKHPDAIRSRSVRFLQILSENYSFVICFNQPTGSETTANTEALGRSGGKPAWTGGHTRVPCLLGTHQFHRRVAWTSESQQVPGFLCKFNRLRSWGWRKINKMKIIRIKILVTTNVLKSKSGLISIRLPVPPKPKFPSAEFLNSQVEATPRNMCTCRRYNGWFAQKPRTTC